MRYSKKVELAWSIAQKGMTFDIVRKSGLLPTIGILNSFFYCGVDDAASELTIHWDPFVLSPSEFDEFVERLRSTMRDLRIDDLGFKEFGDWFSVVAVRISDRR